MNQVQQAACVEYDFTIRREAVLNDEFDYALNAFDYGTILNTEQAQAAWLEYAGRIDTELCASLRVGTDYDYDLYVGLTLKTCTANGMIDGKFCNLEVELFGSFYACKAELIALYVFKFGVNPEFTLVVPK